MRITPVTVLAGPAGSASDLPGRLGDVAFVRDPEPADATGGCTCCALADGLTRELRALHRAHVEGSACFAEVVVDATGHDARPAIAALARAPLASLRFALSGILATSADDALAASLADGLVAQGDALAGRLAEGLYAGGTLRPDGWLARGATRRAIVDRMEPCRWEDVESALQAAQLRAGTRLYRIKGLVGVAGESGPRLVQVFGHTRYPSARLAGWPAGPRHTRFTIAANALETAAIARILQEIPRPP